MITLGQAKCDTNKRMITVTKETDLNDNWLQCCHTVFGKLDHINHDHIKPHPLTVFIFFFLFSGSRTNPEADSMFHSEIYFVVARVDSRQKRGRILRTESRKNDNERQDIDF